MSKYNRVIHKDGKHLEVDVYDVIDAFNMTCPALQHLVKKALCVGIRGHKDEAQDLQDILDSAARAISLAADRADRADGEMMKNTHFLSVPISSLTKEKQQEIKEAIEKVGITGSLNPVFLTEEAAKLEGVINNKMKSSVSNDQLLRRAMRLNEKIKSEVASKLSVNPDFLAEEQAKIDEAAKQFEGETP